MYILYLVDRSTGLDESTVRFPVGRGAALCQPAGRRGLEPGPAARSPAIHQPRQVGGGGGGNKLGQVGGK